MNILQTIGAGIVSIGLFFGGLFGYTPADAPVYTPDEELGRAVNPVATNNYAIAGSGISSSATIITLTSFTAPVSGIPYSMANFGDGVNAKGYLTIEPGSRTRQEIVSFTGITQNSDGSATLSGVSRGLLPFSPFTASSTYATAHSGGSQVTVSNPPQLYDAIYSYIDNATSSGAVDGTTLAKGIYETATGVEAASTTAIGGGSTSATLVLTTLISTSTSPTSGNVVPVTKSDGNLDVSFLPDNFGSSTIRVYTATSTWTRPATTTGLKYIVVEILAGGGGGGGKNSASGEFAGGGSAGGYCKDLISWNDLVGTTSVQVGVGAGGTAGAGAANGVNGGPSSFGSFGSATAGNGGLTSGLGVVSGTGVNCALNAYSGSGLSGHYVSADSGIGGEGGSSIYGSGGVGSLNNTGGNASGYGAGGAGAADTTSSSPLGGVGAPGVVIVTEHY